MGNKDPNIDMNLGRDVVLIHRLRQHQQLMKANRFLVVLVMVLMCVIFLLSLFVLPGDREIFSRIDQRRKVSASYAAVQNPVLSEEVNALKTQVVGLISGSIESKLRILEESIKLGSLRASLGTIEDLRNDVKVLRSYSEPSKALAERQIDQKLIAELSHLKNLIYLVFASCGLMVAAFAGLWLRNRYLLQDKKARHSYLGKK